MKKNFDIERINKKISQHIFFGKFSALKIQYCFDDEEFYFQLGLKKNPNKWEWKKIKLNHNEVGEIIHLCQQKNYSTAFFHKFKNISTQIWIKKNEKDLSIKIDKVSKKLVIGEIEILKIFLEKNLFKKI